MIDPKKLICAFIYSAYASGYCGLRLPPETKKAHQSLYLDFLANGTYYPQKEIEETQEKMMQSVNSSSVQDYIYLGHLDVVAQRIEEETHSTFQEAVNNPMIRAAAMRCPVNFYDVESVRGNVISARNLVLPKLHRDLILLGGLEIPKRGDIVSSHWDYFLEVLPRSEKLDKYVSAFRKYLSRIKS